jgi:hypothetical protein
MRTEPQPESVTPEALRRRHEARAPHLRYALIIAASVLFMLVFCLAGGGLMIRFFSSQRPLNQMTTLGIIHAPDLKPLERFPAPHLEIDDGHAQMTSLFAQQNQKLNSYGWIDRSRGAVRIPIHRAMDLIVERGLPTRTNDLSATGPSALQLLQQRPAQP